MNDFEKAKAFICDKNNSLTVMSEQLNIPLPTLKSYRGNPQKLKTAAWERVYMLAGEYDHAKH